MEQKSENRYDLIVVGLSCAGLSTAYYFKSQIQGSKVLGLDMNSKPGDVGTSSFGDTRLFSHTPGFELRNQMLKDSLEMWTEIEEKTGTHIVHHKTMLALGDKDDRFFQNAASEYGLESMLTPEQITEKYPALENIPSNYTGYVTSNSGIIKSKDALSAYHQLCETSGIEMQFNSKVVEVTKNEVRTEAGEIYQADNVVVACGPFVKTLLDEEDSDLVTVEQEYYELSNPDGMPDLFIEAGPLGAFNGCVNDTDFAKYKFGLHDVMDFEKVKDWVQQRLPSKFDEFIKNCSSKSSTQRHQCSWCFIAGKQYAYKTAGNGVHYLYGFRGHGFAYMPIHGKIVFDTLLNKKAFKYVKFV